MAPYGIVSRATTVALAASSPAPTNDTTESCPFNADNAFICGVVPILLFFLLLIIFFNGFEHYYDWLLNHVHFQPPGEREAYIERLREKRGWEKVDTPETVLWIYGGKAPLSDRFEYPHPTTYLRPINRVPRSDG
jgi:hypothetical protein